MSGSITITIRRRWLRLLAVVTATAAVVAPVAVWATDGFQDVAESDTFHDDIEWLADNGITQGCNPPSNSRFCPDDEVTREQMAAFMRRLSRAEVVEAATARRLGNRTSPFYQRPIAIRTGSNNDGTATTVDDGEIATVRLDPPTGGGVVVLSHSSSWWSGPFELEVWIEPRQPNGQRCNEGGYTDPEAVTGTRAVLSKADVAGQDDYGQVTGTGWSPTGSAARRWSLCIDSFAGNPNNLEWSLSATWYPGAAATTD